MIEIRCNIDPQDALKMLNELRTKQLPYASALALTRTAQDVQSTIRAELPEHFIIRRPWVRQGIRIVPARKGDWPAQASQVYSRDWFMYYQEEGGTKSGSESVPRGPLAAMSEGGTVIPRPKWPGRLLAQRGGHDTGYFYERSAVYQRLPGHRLAKMWQLLPSVDVKARWEMRHRSAQVATEAFQGEFAKAMGQAVSSAK